MKFQKIVGGMNFWFKIKICNDTGMKWMDFGLIAWRMSKRVRDLTLGKKYANESKIEMFRFIYGEIYYLYNN